MIKTLKTERLRKILVPFTLASMQAERDTFVLWYDTARPDSAVGGAATPTGRLEVPTFARDRTRLDPRSRFALARGDPATHLTRRTHRPAADVLDNRFERAHLPILVELREASARGKRCRSA